MNGPALFFDESFDLSLKGRLRLGAYIGYGRVNSPYSILGISEIGAKMGDTDRAGAAQINLLGTNGRKNNSLFSGSSDGHIETSFAAGPVQRPEIHGHFTATVRAIPHTEKHHVTLITLDVFQVLNESVLFRFRLEAIFQVFIFLEHDVDQIFNEPLLWHAKRDHAYGWRSTVDRRPHASEDLGDDRLCLRAIGPRPASVVESVRHMAIFNA